MVYCFAELRQYSSYMHKCVRIQKVEVVNELSGWWLF